MSQPSRVESARRAVRVARYAIGIGAVVALGAFAAAARISHPGSHHSTTTDQAASVSDQSDQDGFFFGGDDEGGSSLGSSGGSSPQLQTGGS